MNESDSSRIERALLDSESRYQRLVEALPLLVWSATPAGEIEFLSPQWYRFTGAPPSASLDAISRDRLHPEDRDRTLAAWRAAVASGAKFHAECRIQAANDTYHWFRASAEQTFDSQGNVSGWLGVTTDFNETKLAEDAFIRQSGKLEAMVTDRTAELAGAVSRIRLLMESSADGLFGLDAAGRITFINRAATSILGYRPQSLLGRSSHEMFHHRRQDGSHFPVGECPIESALHSSGSVRVDNEVFWHRDGHAVPVTYAAHAIVEGGTVQGVVVSFSDNSVRRAAEAARDQALAEAQRLAKVRSEFLANMSHEIRTPLNAVLGFAQLGALDSEDPAVRLMFKRIVDSGQLLLGVINDILDYTKIESGKLTIERRKVSLARLVEHAAAVMRDAAAAKGIDFRVERKAGAPDAFSGDELRVAQVLVNLLSNAVKFTAAGEVVLTVASHDACLVFTVRDTGVGMTRAQIERAFEPFEQADSSMTRRYGGTGLGLAISKRLVGLMGGRISASSEPGMGSTFEFVLPLDDDAAATGRFPRLPTSIRGDREPRLRGVQVLAAEDNENSRLVLEFMLKAEGATATLVNDGAELVSVLEARGPRAFDIVLMDVQMPVMDGYEAARRTRKLAPLLPVVGLTAHAMPEVRDKCLAAGMVEHIAKPVDMDDLVRVIQKHIGVASPRGFEPRSQP